jgi:NADH-quinone oxidoreductase subunit N
MIVYLIWALALELAADRLPKALAIECWDAACYVLSFISLLYMLQLLGSIPSEPFAHGYLYASRGLTYSKLFISLASLFVLSLSETYIREHTRHILEFSLVILVGVLLLLLLVSSNNLMILFLTLSGFSLNLYILILYDGADAASREASLKYFYLSTLSAGMILFGILLIYTTVGDAGYQAIRFYMDSPIDNHARTVIAFGVLFLLLGFFFKLSAFPGHLWAVEVYEGSPLPIMAFFVVPVKVAIFVTFLRLLSTGLQDFSYVWTSCVTISALGSLIWGAFAGAQAKKTTRFLGYASINQIGFLLLGLIVITDDALRSAYFYLILYAIMTGGFLLVFTQLRTERGVPATFISDLAGLSKQETLVSWNLAIFLFCMAGIPPLAGFFAKYFALLALMSKGLFVPAIVALVVSLITAFYYLRIIKTMWFGQPSAKLRVMLTSKQRALLAFFEALLWAGGIFSPWILPLLSEVVATLTVCSDLSTQYSPENPVTASSALGLFAFTASRKQLKERTNTFLTLTKAACFSFWSQLRALPTPLTCFRVFLNNFMKADLFTEENKNHFDKPQVVVQNSKIFFYVAGFVYGTLYTFTSFGATYLGIVTPAATHLVWVFAQSGFLIESYVFSRLLYLGKSIAYALGWWMNTPDRKNQEFLTFIKNWNRDSGAHSIFTTVCLTPLYYIHFIMCQSTEITGYLTLFACSLLFHFGVYCWLRSYYRAGCVAGKYVAHWLYIVLQVLSLILVLLVVVLLICSAPDRSFDSVELCLQLGEDAPPAPPAPPVTPPAFSAPKAPQSQYVTPEMIKGMKAANYALYKKTVIKPLVDPIAKLISYLDFNFWVDSSPTTTVAPAQTVPSSATDLQTIFSWQNIAAGLCTAGLFFLW